MTILISGPHHSRQNETLWLPIIVGMSQALREKNCFGAYKILFEHILMHFTSPIIEIFNILMKLLQDYIVQNETIDRTASHWLARGMAIESLEIGNCALIWLTTANLHANFSEVALVIHWVIWMPFCFLKTFYFISTRLQNYFLSRPPSSLSWITRRPQYIWSVNR